MAISNKRNAQKVNYPSVSETKTETETETQNRNTETHFQYKFEFKVVGHIKKALNFEH